jgi:hypothetical protein
MVVSHMIMIRPAAQDTRVLLIAAMDTVTTLYQQHHDFTAC